MFWIKRLDASTKTVDRIKYVRGIYNIMLSEDMNCPQNVIYFLFQKKSFLKGSSNFRSFDNEKKYFTYLEKKAKYLYLKCFWCFNISCVLNFIYHQYLHSTHSQISQQFSFKFLLILERPLLLKNCLLINILFNTVDRWRRVWVFVSLEAYDLPND